MNQVSVRIDDELFSLLESSRGTTSRSAYIVESLAMRLGLSRPPAARGRPRSTTMVEGQVSEVRSLGPFSAAEHGGLDSPPSSLPSFLGDKEDVRLDADGKRWRRIGVGGDGMTTDLLLRLEDGGSVPVQKGVWEKLTPASEDEPT